MREKIEKKSVALTQKEFSIVNEFSDKNEISFSAALRLIIRQWDIEKRNILSNSKPQTNTILD